MAEFWVGVPGDLTAEQFTTLTRNGITVEALRQTAGGRGEPPIEWRTLRTFVRVPAGDESAARARVADALTLPTGELIAYPAGTGSPFD
jgi:hypothetical protein